jgi:hypothetical protein
VTPEQRQEVFAILRGGIENVPELDKIAWEEVFALEPVINRWIEDAKNPPVKSPPGPSDLLCACGKKADFIELGKGAFCRECRP